MNKAPRTDADLEAAQTGAIRILVDAKRFFGADWFGSVIYYTLSERNQVAGTHAGGRSELC